VSIAALALALLLGACGAGDDASETAVPTTTPVAETAVRERFENLVADVLERRELDRATIECALEQLATSVSDEEIKAATDEIRQTGVPPPDVIEAAAAAGEACGDSD